MSVMAPRRLPAACRRTTLVAAAADDTATNAAIHVVKIRIIISPNASPNQPLTGASCHPRGCVDAEYNGHEHNAQSHREREIALRRLQRDRRCHGTGKPVDVAADDDDGADLSCCPPKSGEHGRHET